MQLKIGNRIIGDGQKPYFIADIAANHDGDINRAYKLIELVKQAGADAAKFQNFKARSIVSEKSFNDIGNRLSHQANWEKSVFEMYEAASLPDDWTPLLKDRCNRLSIEYMTSPYDFEAADLANHYVNAFKIGSGDITWIDILEHIAKKEKPIILGTGASTLGDVRKAVNAMTQYNKEIVLLQCNTNYTADIKNLSNINLNVLNTYRKEFPECLLGISDHTHGHLTVLGAVALGACVIEKHFTDDNSRAGPDHKFSMTPDTWREMVDRVNDLYIALGDGVKRIESNEAETSIIQRRSLHYTRSIKSGDKLVKGDLFPVRPIKVDGLEPYREAELIGKTLSRDVYADDYARREDFE